MTFRGLVEGRHVFGRRYATEIGRYIPQRLQFPLDSLMSRRRWQILASNSGISLWRLITGDLTVVEGSRPVNAPDSRFIGAFKT